MKRLILVLAAITLFYSCHPAPKVSNLTYRNIVILSDLSDRLDPIINGQIPNQHYPTKDLQEISGLLKYFRNECVKPGEKIGDRSSILFSTFHNPIIAKINLDEFTEISVKQEFINSTGRFKNNGLDYELEKFEKTVEETYKNTRNNGLDLISLLVDHIENKSLIKFDTTLIFGRDSTHINYLNDFYIFTDGYLEYKGKNVNNQFYFSNNEIEKIRKYCQQNNVDIETAMNENPKLCLPPVKNKIHNLITLNIVETHERDKNTELQTYKNPKGLRDNEILYAVWKKWAKESGFKDLKWKKY